MVGCIRKINSAKYAPKTIRCRNYKKYSSEQLNKDLSETDWSPLYNMLNVNNAVEYFNEKLTSLFNSHAPIIQKRVKGKPCEWISDELRFSMNERDKALRLAKKSQKKSDWDRYKKLRNSCNNNIKRSKQSYHKNVLQENSTNPAGFWKAIKTIFPTKSKTSISPLDLEEKQNKANVFSNYFSNVVNSLKEKAFVMTNFVWKHPPFYSKRTTRVFKFKYVTKTFVEKQLRLLKRKKATGLYELPSSLLKDCAINIAQPVTFLVNLSLKSCSVPELWKKSRIAPIFKSGNSDDSSNYRPVSILPILSKVLEKAVHKQLSDYLEDSDLLSNCQFGFRKQKSTKSAATVFTDDIRKFVDGGNLIGAVFVDLSKAFDTINYCVLLNKLKSYGIEGDEHQWFTSYMFNRKQIVEVDTIKSNEAPLLCGVPQGSILGPLLFIMHLNDLPERLNHCKVVIYADDTVFYFPSSSLNEIEDKLNADLINLSNYFRENELLINLKKGKTESLLFGTSKRLNSTYGNFEVRFDNNLINNVKQYKYLGNILDQNLNLQANFSHTYRKASGRMHLLLKIKPYLTNVALRLVYMTMVLPLLMYSGTVHLNYTPTQQNKIKSIERRAHSIISSDKPLPCIYDQIKKEACKTVRKCLDGDCCNTFKHYFKIRSGSIQTRNNGFMVELPKVKLSFAKNSFYYTGAKIYNDLPLNIRKTSCEKEFLKLLKDHKF